MHEARARLIESEEKLMIALSRTSLVLGAAFIALGLGCSRSPSAPAPLASSGTTRSASPNDRRAANDDEPSGGASNEALDETGLPLPRGTTLVSSGTVDDVHVFPARGKLGPDMRVVAGGVGAGAVDHVYETPLSYAQAVAFYDRVLELGKQSPYSLDGEAAHRTTQGKGTEWVFSDDNGDPERVEVSGTTPTRISITRETAAAAVETEQAGRANAQPGTNLGRSEAAHRAANARDGGRSAPPSSPRNGE
jgi:hypothetical protein